MAKQNKQPPLTQRWLIEELATVLCKYLDYHFSLTAWCRNVVKFNDQQKARTHQNANKKT